MRRVHAAIDSKCLESQETRHPERVVDEAQEVVLAACALMALSVRRTKKSSILQVHRCSIFVDEGFFSVKFWNGFICDGVDFTWTVGER